MKVLLLALIVAVATAQRRFGGGNGQGPFGRRAGGGQGGGQRGRQGRGGPRLPPACQADVKKMADCLNIDVNPMQIARQLGVFGPPNPESCLNAGGCDQNEFREIVRETMQAARNGGNQGSQRCREPNSSRRGKRQSPFGAMEPPPCPTEEVKECIRENLDGSIKAEIRECMSDGTEQPPAGSNGGNVQQKTAVMQIVSSLMANKDRLMNVCSDPEALISCAREKIREKIDTDTLREKCECFVGPSEECKQQAKELRQKACGCFNQAKSKLSACQGTGNFDELAKSMNERICNGQPPQLPKKPPMCEELADEYDGLYDY